MLKLDQTEREELFDRIAEALDEMPDLLRQTFVLSHYRGLGADEISKKIDIKVQEIPALLRRGNSLFHEKLKISIPKEKDHSVGP